MMRWRIGHTDWHATYLVLCVMAVVTSGCAFDVSHAKQVPTSFVPVKSARVDWTLLEDRTIPLGTGFPTRLKAQTHWSLVGRVPQGDVYQTSGQIVTVEESNIYEALVVMREGNLVGFYLPVERSLVPVEPPVTLPISKGGQS
jgi:hypothetical protein